MILTNKQIQNTPNGTILTLFYAGSEWQDDFGKTSKVIKFDNKMYEIKSGFIDVQELNDMDGYEIIVAKQ